MQRFLGSLKVHVNESKTDLKYCKHKTDELNDEFKQIRSKVNKTISYNNFKKKNFTKTIRTISKTQKNIQNEIKYIPASQYPAPMQPILFKPKLQQSLVEKIFILNKNKHNSNEIIINDDSKKLPSIEIDHISIKSGNINK